MRVRLRRGIRITGALLLLVIAMWWVEPHHLLKELRALSLLTLTLAAAVALPTYLLFAWRWQAFCEGMRIHLPFSRALREYFMAGFANQALPTGLAGAALRAFRHSKGRDAEGGPVGMRRAALAVLLDRLAGVLALVLSAIIASLVLLLFRRELALAALFVCALVLFVAFISLAMVRRRWPTISKTLRLVMSYPRLRFRVVMSSLGSASLLTLAYAFTALSAGVPLGLGLILGPLVLSSMLVPLSVAGWGIREAASILLYGAMGLEVAEGVAISVAFGLVSFVVALPGALFWTVDLTQTVDADSGAHR